MGQLRLRDLSPSAFTLDNLFTLSKTFQAR